MRILLGNYMPPLAVKGRVAVIRKESGREPSKERNTVPESRPCDPDVRGTRHEGRPGGQLSTAKQKLLFCRVKCV